MLPARGRTLESITYHAFDAVPGVDADLGGDLVRGVDANGSTVAGVRPLGALPDHDEVDVGIAREWRRHAWEAA